MDNSVGIVIINHNNTQEEVENCIKSIKTQTYKNLKVICVGGPYNKAEILNKGISTIAKTDFLLTVEAQQYLCPAYVEKTLQAMQKHSAFVGVVYTNYIIDGYKKYIPSFSRRKLTSYCDIPNTALIKREVFENCGLYDSGLDFLENWDMWMRISEKYVLFHIPDHLYSDEDKQINIDAKKVNEIKDKILEKTLKRTSS